MSRESRKFHVPDELANLYDFANTLDLRKFVHHGVRHEQAEELAIQSGNFADALAHRPTSAGLEQRVRAKAKDASTLSARLWRLHDHPTDRAGARELAVEFKKAGNCS